MCTCRRGTWLLPTEAGWTLCCCTLQQLLAVASPSKANIGNLCDCSSAAACGHSVRLVHLLRLFVCRSGCLQLMCCDCSYLCCACCAMVLFAIDIRCAMLCYGCLAMAFGGFGVPVPDISAVRLVGLRDTLWRPAQAAAELGRPRMCHIHDRDSCCPMLGMVRLMTCSHFCAVHDTEGWHQVRRAVRWRVISVECSHEVRRLLCL